ncbi:hypothetical protein AZH53_00225 [Methanomicrobiaceae archaeon CYW5]|uniref:ATP-binding protein n=1 Tax=Methanovulcanius yangii TaxID=1789227 RepID=UPI0029CA5DA4|nr:ATP-binding protein [Methanovulcanius yangii]MBT8506856.1 hypothetical protein [Methanovulcanius yangii]
MADKKVYGGDDDIESKSQPLRERKTNMSEEGNSCIAFSLKFATATGVSALVDATKRQMTACSIPEEKIDAICLAIEEVFLDILENSYPTHRGYLAFSCSYEDGELLIRVSDHAPSRNILQEEGSSLASLLQSTFDEATHSLTGEGNRYEMKVWMET